MIIKKLSEQEAIDIYTKIYRQECKKNFKNLQNGTRILKLMKSRIEIHSYKDMLKQDKPFIPSEDLCQSINISLGYVTQDTASSFIIEMAKLFPDDVELVIAEKKKKKYKCFGLLLDIQPFVIDNFLFLYESKNNIDLDKDKTHITSSRTKQIGKAVENIQKIFANGYDTKSLIVVWSKAKGDDVWKIANKKHLDKNCLKGVNDFFEPFADVTHSFYDKLRKAVTKICDDEIYTHIPDRDIPLDIEKFLLHINKQGGLQQLCLLKFGDIEDKKRRDKK